MEIHVAWKSLYYEGEEKATLKIGEQSIGVESEITWRDEKGTEHVIRYKLTCRADWSVRDLIINSDVAAKPLELHGDGNGSWTNKDGEVLKQLQGCIDVDFQATPLTNILPIRRLGSDHSERVRVRMVYILFPDLQFYAVDQYYTKIGENRWRFEQPIDDFTAEIEVDEVGLVQDYPGLFERK